MISIDKNVPLPENIRQWGKYPFKKMAVNDSFFVEAETTLEAERIKRSLSCLQSRYRPMKFTTRTVEGGVRCWRIL